MRISNSNIVRIQNESFTTWLILEPEIEETDGSGASNAVVDIVWSTSSILAD